MSDLGLTTGECSWVSILAGVGDALEVIEVVGLLIWVEVSSDDVALSCVGETSPGVRIVTTKPVDEEDFETDDGGWLVGDVEFVLVLLGSEELASWVPVGESSRAPVASCTAVSCASSSPSVAFGKPTGRSVTLEKLLGEGGVEAQAESLIGLGVNCAAELLVLSSGEFREVREVNGAAGDVTALWQTFPGAVGRPFPRAATLFPYSSRLFVEPASSTAGVPIAKLPRGMGTPPFLSNLAILSRRVPRGRARDASRGGNVGDGVGEGELLRCWRAAMRSFKLFGGDSVADLKRG